MIKINAGNARHASKLGRTIAKYAFIFLGNAEVDYFRLKLIVHVLIRSSLVNLYGFTVFNYQTPGFTCKIGYYLCRPDLKQYLTT